MLVHPLKVLCEVKWSLGARNIDIPIMVPQIASIGQQTKIYISELSCVRVPLLNPIFSVSSEEHPKPDSTVRLSLCLYDRDCVVEGGGGIADGPS